MFDVHIPIMDVWPYVEIQVTNHQIWLLPAEERNDTRKEETHLFDFSTLVRTWHLFNRNTAFDSSSLLVRVRCSFECESFGRPVPRQN
jgi:hypothetical protein